MGRTTLDRGLAGLARSVLAIFFRRVELSGFESLPQSGPGMLLPNHINSLVDPMLVVGYMPFAVRFLAKSTLWQHPVVKYLVRLAGAIPVYRRHDPGVDPADNEATFERCYRALAAGEVIALFPEGLSHGEPSLMPMKTGAARIALEAEARHGPLDQRLIPLGMTFDDKARFRSRVLLQAGEPIDPAAYMPQYRDDGQSAVRALTEQIDKGLRRVTLNYDSWEEARLIERAAQIWERPEIELPVRQQLTRSVETRRAFIEGYRQLSSSHPHAVTAVVEATRAYDRLLRRLHLDDRQVAATYPTSMVAPFIGRTALLLLWKLPLALLGTLLNWLPYRVPGWLVTLLRVPSDLQATYKILVSLAVFPAVWVAEAWFVGSRIGSGAGFATLVLAPASGYLALRFSERLTQFVDEARAYLRLRTRKGAVAELRRRRGEVFARVGELAALYEA